MPTSNDEFKKVSVKEPIKREIAILAATEDRHEYEIVADALKLYKVAALKRGTKSPRNLKNVPVSEIIATH
jgi:hypothetical protein